MLKRNGLAINQDDSVICVPQQQQDTNDLVGIPMSDSHRYVDVLRQRYIDVSETLVANPFQDYISFSIKTGFPSTQRYGVSCQDEVKRLSEVRLSCLQNLPWLLKAIFQSGQISHSNSNHYVCFPWRVVMDADNDFGGKDYLPLPPCGWHNRLTGQFGFDTISLYSDLLGPSYESALDIFSENFIRNPKKKNQCWAWVQEKYPIRVQFPLFGNPNFYIDPSQLFKSTNTNNDMFKIYMSSNGQHMIGFVLYNRSLRENVREYITLWRQREKQRVHWLPICPQKPYMLYNLDKITNIPDVPVFFVEDEWQAAQLQESKYGYQFVFTTCPMGLIYLPEADLSALNGRDVVIHLSPSSHKQIQILPKFIDKARKKGIKKIHLIIDDYKTHIITAEEFLKEPNKYGYEGTLDNIQIGRRESLIIAPGEKMPGEDIERRTILDPIIKSGHTIWLYAATGVGKSWLSICIAYAVAKGHCQIGPWRSNKAMKVLYIDGEMNSDELRLKINMIKAGYGDKGIAPIHLISAGSTGTINILDTAWQKDIEPELKDYDLIIFDNLYSLTENRNFEIKPLLRWFKKLNKLDIAVVAVDHSNREDKIQGSVEKERAADTIIELSIINKNADVKNGDDNEGEEMINVSILKARSLPPELTKPLLLKKIYTQNSFKLEEVQQTTGKPSIPGEDKQFAMIKFMKKYKGYTFKQISEELGIRINTVQHRYGTQIKNLSPSESKKLDQEVKRLIDEHRPSAEPDA